MNSVIARAWDDYLKLAEQYYIKNGNLNIPYNYQAGPYRLWEWLDWQRDRYRKGVLPAERVSALEALGIDWTAAVNEDWPAFYAEAKAFYEANGHLFVPLFYRTKQHYDLGRWIQFQRERYTGSGSRHKNLQPLSPEEIRKLEEIGMVWENVENAKWETMYAQVENFRKKHRRLPRPGRDGKAPDGRDMGRWVRRQREAMKNGTLDEGRRVRLRRIGIEARTDPLRKGGSME